MKTILVFGAGKSATVLIDYLKTTVAEKNWKLIVADANPELAKAKLGDAINAEAVEVNVTNADERRILIEAADIVISLLPPFLHIHVVNDCVAIGRNLLNASYVDDAIKNLEAEIRSKELLFLCEMGLDPGIDHMSAMQLFDEIRAKGGTITSFKSHCGGLVAPESDDNPWHYKISWNPRNIVMAGQAGAAYKENGQVVKKGEKAIIDIPVARLPSGTMINIPVHVYRGEEDGPRLLLLAGLHGDEINGVETIRRMIKSSWVVPKKGSVICIPILNIFGFVLFSFKIFASISSLLTKNAFI